MNRLFMAQGQNQGGPTMGGASKNTKPITDAQLVQQGVIFETEGGQLVMYDGQGNKTWFVDTTGGNVTITFPAANADNAIGVTFTVKRKTGGANTLTISPVSGNIDGAATASMPTQNDFRQYRSDGTDYWRVTGGEGISDGDRGDITVSGGGTVWTIDNDAVTYAKMQNISATSRILGRKTAAAGDTEECTLSEVLDFVGSAAQGDILYRSSATWARLGAGTNGQFLQTQGTGANPQWAAGVVQVVNTQTGAVATTTTTIPDDDTIPQQTEGGEFMTLAITPKGTTNRLKIDVVVVYASSAANENAVALFQDSTANALAAVGTEVFTANEMQTVSFSHFMTAGTTSSTTFKVRAGGLTAGTFTFNGAAGGRKFGGVLASSITITEIAA